MNWIQPRIKELEIEMKPYCRIVEAGIPCLYSKEYEIRIQLIQNHINDLKKLLNL